MRRLLAVSLVAASLAAASAAPAVETAASAADRAAACAHYANRARFKPREGDVDFTVRLADSCAAALTAVEDPGAPAPARAAAASFLDLLAGARATIAEINHRRIGGEGGALRLASTDSRQPIDLARALGLVTPTGEFLILRAEGVFDAFERWRAAAPGARG